MKQLIHILIVLLCFLTLGQVQAQVEVRLEPVRKELVLGENVSMKLTLVNHTDATIALRNTPVRPWLVFSVYQSGESASMVPLARAKFPAVSLAPGSRHSFQLNLSPFYNFVYPGSYHVVASVIMPDGKTVYSSNRPGVSLSHGSDVRTFTIQARGQRLKIGVKLLKVNGKNCLFGQVLNADTKHPVGACYLGQYLNFMEPRIMLDSAQNLHCLCQSTPEYFTYSVMNTKGKRASYQLLQRTGGPIDMVSTGKGLRTIGLAPAPKKSAQPAGRRMSERPF